MISEIRYQVDLALRLIDTVTGNSPGSLPIRFSQNGVRLSPLYKEDCWIFCGIGRTPCSITVHAPGFEPRDIALSAELLSQRLPLLCTHLTPTADYRSPLPFHKLEGTLPGLTALELTAANGCGFSSFDAERCILRLSNPHQTALDRTYYALIRRETAVFEPFSILERLSDTDYRVDHVPRGTFHPGDPVGPVTFGTVLEDGRYFACARALKKKEGYLARLIQNGRERFLPVDFDGPAPFLKGG